MILIASQLFLSFCFIISLSFGDDTLVVNQSLYGDQTLVSLGGNFELGFFKPGNSPNYYIGIWYKKVTTTPATIVWVANRETPISDRFSSKLKIIDGNLVLLNESNAEIWSTNMISTTTNSASVVLLNDGNLVLSYGSNTSSPIWQSFDHPTHTFLPGSKLGYNRRTDTKQLLTSWRSTEDPAVRLFSLEVDQDEKQYKIMWNRSEQYWTSGPWNGRIFSLVPEMRLNYIFNFSYIENPNESYFTYSLYNPSIISRLILDVSGQIKQMTWLDSMEQWNLFWSQPRQVCEVYSLCGAFSTCNENALPFCNCLTAFEPRSLSEWNLGGFSGGCVRKTKLNCRKEEKLGFIVSYVPVKFLSLFLENETSFLGESACKTSCLTDCTCDAYTFVFKTCRLWSGENLDSISRVLVSDDSNSVTFPFNIKVSSSDLAPNNAKINTKVLVAGIISGFVGLVFLCSVGIIFYRRVKRRGSREENRENLQLQFHNGATSVRLVDLGVFGDEDRKGIDVPFFEFKSILSATENFSLANKLGQGGFGPVYKGKLPGGTEVAVKRLSSQSGQGLKEFKNEVLLIAKLQHRNLVRLLGYSMKDHEMILLYEFMPNKSLDRFIFGRFVCILTGQYALISSWELLVDFYISIKIHVYGLFIEI